LWPHVVSLWPEAGAIPPELRVAVEVVVVAWLLVRGLPMAVRGASRLVGRAAEPVASLLLLPEYALTSALRRAGLSPVPGTHSFGTGLGQLVSLLQSLAIDVRNWLSKPWPVPWKLVLGIALLPFALGVLRLPLASADWATPFVRTIDQVQSSWRPLDGLVMTGKREPYGQLLLAVRPNAACKAQP
jgi:hypothetical protein